MENGAGEEAPGANADSGAAGDPREAPTDELAPAVERVADDGTDGLTDAVVRVEGNADDGLTDAVVRAADDGDGDTGGADATADDGAVPDVDEEVQEAIDRVVPMIDNEGEVADDLGPGPYEHLPSAVERVDDMEPESVSGTDYDYVGPAGASVDAEEDGDDPVTTDPDAVTVEEPVDPRGEEPAETYETVEDYEDPFAEGPESDEEMPLADHIEEMVMRLGVVLVVVAVASGIVFPFGERLINGLWYSILPGTDVARPRVYHPLALVLARLKVATLAGFVVGLPVLVYQAYLFMRPGLYQRERRYFLASVPTSLVLASVGVVFAWRLVLPALFTYFLRYSEQATVIAFGLTETFGLMVVIMGYFAFIFQIPLLIMLAIMMGVTSREWLESRRLYFWGGFIGVALLFSPDPTGMVPFIVAATMLVLFEGTLLLLRWTGR